MPSNKNFAYRIEIIDECLRNRYRKWTLQGLIETINEKLTERNGKQASKRSIQADLAFMKNEKNAPIEKKKEGNTTYFFYSDPSFSLKNLPIDEEEIILLSDAISILRQVNDFKILQDVDEIVSKLENTINTNVDGSPLIIQFEKHTLSTGSEYIDNIFTAIKLKKPLRITYQSFKAQSPEKYVFHPYLLKEYRNRWFLIGRRENANAITNLALDRIREIRNSDADYIPNNLFDPETYFNSIIGVTTPNGEKVQSIEIKVAAKQVPYILTKPLHHTQEILKKYLNGDILIRVYLISNYELQSVLLGYGCDIEIVKPVSLRNSIKEILEKALGCYR